MSRFTYKEIYIEAGRRVLEVNLLPGKHCNFDCIFCPIGRAEKVDRPMTFEGMEEALRDLEAVIEDTRPDLVFINSMGEAFLNDRLGEIVKCIQGKAVAVRLLTNGYLLGEEPFRSIAAACDEVLGEIKAATEETFQRIQRPIEGYTLEEHVRRMADFNRQYQGVFLLEITLLRGYNDSPEAVEATREFIRRIAPDRLRVERMTDDRFKGKLGIDDETFEAISKALRQDLQP